MLTVAAATVVIVGAASCYQGVWVWRTDGVYREFGCSLVRGALHAGRSDRSARAATFSRIQSAGWRWECKPAIGEPVVEWTPGWSRVGPPTPSWSVRIPLWIPAVLLGAPAGWLWWRWKKRPPGGCVWCGYDLRGLAGEKCPECGRTRRGTDAVRT